MAKLHDGKIEGIAVEISSIIGSFTDNRVLKGYFCLAITKDLFDSEESYLDFFDMLSEFREQIIKNGFFKKGTILAKDTIILVTNIFKKMYDKYPSQTDRLILECIYEMREKAKTTAKESIEYVRQRDILSHKMVARSMNDGKDYYRIIGMISSKDIMTYIPNITRTKTEEEFIDQFLVSVFGMNACFYLLPEDIAYAVKDPRSMGAAYFSAYTIFNLNNYSQLEKYRELILYLKGEIKNFDIDKIKQIMFYRYYYYLSTKTEPLTLDELKILEDGMKLLGKTIMNKLQRDDVKFQMPKLDVFDLEIVSSLTGQPYKEKKKTDSKSSSLLGPVSPLVSKQGLDNLVNDATVANNQRKQYQTEFPVLVTKTDLNYEMQTITLDREVIDIPKGLIFKWVNRTILKGKLNLLITAAINNNEIDEYLKTVLINDETIEIMRNIVSEMKLSPEKLSEVEGTILKRLYDDKIFSLNDMLNYNGTRLAEGFLNGEFDVETFEFSLIKSNVDKTPLVEAALSNSQLLNKLFESGNISKSDLFTLELSSYTKLIEIFFNSNNLAISEIAELFKLGKITLTDIENMNIENVHIDDNDIVSIYCRIQEKKNEYEEYIKRKYADADLQGLTDEDVVETEEEKRLQTELQELINTKNVYVALYNKQKLKPLVRYHRTTDIYDGIGEYFIDGENFKKSLSDITNMLYEDSLISIAQVKQMDDSLVIDILKSGHACKEDIDRFKQEIVTPGEINKIRDELSQELEGEGLEKAIREKIYILTYNKLYDLMDKIVKDKNSSKEEKLSILYTIFYKNTTTEKTHREFFETEILVKIYSKMRTRNKKPIIDPTDQVPISDTEIEPDDEEKEPKNSSKSYVYQTNVIWEFIKILDPNCKFRILSDGYVLFESEKLNKVFIENVWQSGKDGDFIRRGYGATTLILDLDTFKKNQSDIIKRGRHGYKIDAFNAKKHLPQVQVAEGKTKTTGSIIHEKDLKNTGKKIWFELILDHLGITQDNINTKQTNYTQQDLDAINKFIAMSKHKYEEVTR